MIFRNAVLVQLANSDRVGSIRALYELNDNTPEAPVFGVRASHSLTTYPYCGEYRRRE